MKNLIIGAFLLIFSPLAAQKHSDKNLPGTRYPKNQYVANTIIIKLKPEMKNSISGGIIYNEALLKVSKTIKLTAINKLIPGARTPKARKGVGGKDMVDLSNIYIINYEGKNSVEEVTRMLEKTGLVEYAEPQYMEKLFLIPNDPEAQPNSGKQYALENIKAYEAWDIEKGDTNVYIGIVDTDTDINNPDLINKVKRNYKDPVNGIDDDHDQYIDNFSGWDLADKDNDVRAKNVPFTAKTKSSTGGDSTYTDTLRGNGHSTMVSGCAAAETNNGLGVAGTGFNTKFLPIKAMPDSSAGSGGILKGYEGIVYAAEHGCKVINLSWGGGNNYSSFNQEVINYAAINYDVVIVAAAGNDSTDEDFYPASYDNVLSVAASDVKYSPERNKNIDVKAWFASYSYKVDICAPGNKIYSTSKLGYAYDGGSSFSSPYVAGAAALVRSKFPHWNATQVQEQLRITADVIDTLPENKAYREKIGKGRLNMYRALTDSLNPAIRMYSHDFPDNITKFAFAGDTIRLTAKFRNYLHATSALKIRLSSNSPYIKMLDSIATIGVVVSLDSFNNNTHPFIFIVSKNIPSDFNIALRFGYDDGSYQDYQYFKSIVNPSFITIDTNQVALTVTSKGRLGYNDATDGYGGIGFVYKNQNLLFEAGLMVSTDTSKVSDCVRGNPVGDTDEDFAIKASEHYVTPTIASEETVSEFFDNKQNKIGVEIMQNSYAWHAAPDDKFVILSYNIKNISGTRIDTLHTGIFADWDIMNSEHNKADWDSASRLGYTYSTDNNGLYAGINILSDADVSCYSLDHSSTIGGNNIFPNDGFTTLEKYTTLSKGVYRKKAGDFSSSGGDVSQVIGATIYGIENNETKTIAYAMVAGDDLKDLIKSAAQAQVTYNNLKVITTVSTDVNTGASLAVFPNPFAGKFEIASGQDDPIESLVVLSISGKEVFQESHPASSYSVNLQNQPSGLYIVKITLKNKVFTQKIIKQ